MACRALLSAGLLFSVLAALPSPAQEILKSERLLVFPEASWQVARRESKPTLTMVEYVPKGETVENWTRMLTVQVFSGDQTPLATWGERFRSGFPVRWNCEPRQLISSVSGRKNGYEWMRFIAICNSSACFLMPMAFIMPRTSSR